MSLAATLRAALGRRHEVELIAGDALELEEGPVPAAVLVPIVDRPRPGLILTVRPQRMRRHPGQISFPGGRIDPEDDGPVAAALREAEEEIGLPRGTVDVIGPADCYITGTGFAVTPVVGIVPPGLELAPHPDEVEAVFEAPLDYLLDPVHHQVRSREWRGRPRSYYEIEWQDRRIWGATAAMIVNLGRMLAPGEPKARGSA
ncbi:MAG: CoA pyrophosphatase [Sphingosinicella sp.]